MDLIKEVICLKDFEEIYNKIYFKFKDKIEEINNNQKEIKKQALFKMIKFAIIIAIIFLVLILVTKNMELLALLIFVPGPLMLYYFSARGNKIRTTELDIDTDKIQEQIHKDVISDCFNGLQYNGKQGISSEIYDKGRYGNYNKYYSEDRIEGILKSKNGHRIEMSYIATSRGSTSRDNFIWTFRGYFLVVELNKSTKLQVKINEEKIEYLDNQGSIEENNVMLYNIQNILKQFKEKNKIASDVTICYDKLYIRLLTNEFVYNILNKDSLKKYYNGITEIINLTSEILKNIDE